MAALSTAALLRSASARLRRPVPGKLDMVVKANRRTYLLHTCQRYVRRLAMDENTPGLPGRDVVGYLELYPQEITFGDEDPAEIFDRYHAPGFVLHNDGVPLDRDRLLAHVASGRERAAEIRIVVHDVATTGDVVAARYELTAIMRKGQ